MMYAGYMGVSFISRVIEARTWSKYSHVSIILSPAETIIFCEFMRKTHPNYPDYDEESEVESWQDGGVVHNKHWGSRHTPGTKVDLFEYKIKLTEHEICKGIVFLSKQIGKKYDYAGVVGCLWIGRLFGIVHNLYKWFCSELAAAFANEMSRQLSGKKTWKTVPDDVVTSVVLKLSERRKVPMRGEQ